MNFWGLLTYWYSYLISANGAFQSSGEGNQNESLQQRGFDGALSVRPHGEGEGGDNTMAQPLHRHLEYTGNSF